VQIIIKPDAETDIRQAHAWYLNLSAAVAERYLSELDEAFALLTKFPEASPVCLNSCRQYVMKRFPYLIVFEPADEVIFIHAVFHASRDRTTIVQRLS